MDPSEDYAGHTEQCAKARRMSLDIRVANDKLHTV